MSKYLWILLLAGVWGEVYAQEYLTDHFSDTGTAVIYGMINSYEAPHHDSIRYRCYTGPLWYYPEGNDYQEGVCEVRAGNLMEGAGPGHERVFDIRLSGLRGPSYVKLKLGVKDPILDYYLIRPGDTIWMKIDYTRGHTLFGGANGDLFRCQYELQLAMYNSMYARNSIMKVEDSAQFVHSTEKILRLYEDSRIPGRRKMLLEPYGREGIKALQNRIDRIWKEEFPHRMDILADYAGKIDPATWDILRADILGDLLLSAYSKFITEYRYARMKEDSETMDELDRLFGEKLSGYDERFLQDEVILHSREYRRSLESRAQCLAFKEGGKSIDYLSKLQVPRIRDVLTAKYLIENFAGREGMYEWTKEVLLSIEDPYCRMHLEEWLHHWVDQKVEPLSLPDTEGRTVDIRDLEGKVVLLDFWFTGCKPCVWFHKTSLSKVKAHFADEEDFAVLSVSVDRSRDTWLKSVASGQYTSDAAINVHIKGRDHPFLKAYGILGYPTVLLVDREGRMTGSAVPRDAEEMIEVIKRKLD
ncbi:TlpA family protein disulfide reductase [Membranihabitans maritimus]|uniref:TlpA family protein disulfide reductase n=1 Tax=Membranihabitans maritimus TaxID=2904244 RepID=UPI001F31C4B6|nr:TlpA disulfide reductase family protein [Membranihabitans maritimus]